MEGVTFLTDPIISERCSPFQWMGPKRVVPPALDLFDKRAPKIDFVVISHSHYDHLVRPPGPATGLPLPAPLTGAPAASPALPPQDVPTVRAFRDRFDDSITWYVPLGLKAWFNSLRVSNVVELDWWQARRRNYDSDPSPCLACASPLRVGRLVSLKRRHCPPSPEQEAVHPRRPASSAAPSEPAGPSPAAAAAAGGLGGVRVVCTPCQHWSARTPFDKNKTLWSSWAVVGRHRRFWFGGDTGYCSVFKEIGDRLGPFDLSAIPIAAYEPRWFHRPAHLDPADAVKVHQDVRSRRSVGVHCCTWSLTDEPLDEPPKLLVRGGGDCRRCGGFGASESRKRRG